MKNNLVLIGMPSSGKSTVGVILAKILGKRFIDTDLLIQQRSGKLLSQLIEQDGIDGFLKLENDLCAHLEAENAVIATGGSVVYGAEAMAHLSQIGRIIYLKTDLAELKKRVGDITTRGVIMRPGEDFDALFAERTPLYEEYAELTAESSGALERTAEQVLRLLKRDEARSPEPESKKAFPK